MRRGSFMCYFLAKRNILKYEHILVLAMIITSLSSLMSSIQNSLNFVFVLIQPFYSRRSSSYLSSCFVSTSTPVLTQVLEGIPLSFMIVASTPDSRETVPVNFRLLEIVSTLSNLMRLSMKELSLVEKPVP